MPARSAPLLERPADRGHGGQRFDERVDEHVGRQPDGCLRSNVRPVVLRSWGRAAGATCSPYVVHAGDRPAVDHSGTCVIALGSRTRRTCGASAARSRRPPTRYSCGDEQARRGALRPRWRFGWSDPSSLPPVAARYSLRHDGDRSGSLGVVRRVRRRRSRPLCGSTPTGLLALAHRQTNRSRPARLRCRRISPFTDRWRPHMGCGRFRPSVFGHCGIGGRDRHSLDRGAVYAVDSA